MQTKSGFGKCTYINDLLTDNTNPTLRVFGIVEDKNKNLWIATLGSGLYSINLNSQQVHHYKALVGNQYRPEANVLNNDWIESMLLTRDEKLYVGTMDGVGCLDLKSLQFTSTFGGKNRILPGTPIHALYEDSANTIWVGTSDGVRIHPGDARFSNAHAIILPMMDYRATRYMASWKIRSAACGSAPAMALHDSI